MQEIINLKNTLVANDFNRKSKCYEGSNSDLLTLAKLYESDGRTEDAYKILNRILSAQ
jgi:hypothetical protein